MDVYIYTSIDICIYVFTSGFLSFFISQFYSIDLCCCPCANTDALITVALRLGSVSPPLCSLSRLFSLFCVPYISI